MSRIPVCNLYHDLPRDSRLSVLTCERIKSELDKISTMNRTTISNIVNEALIAYIGEHRTDIQSYDKVFGDDKETAI